MAEPAAAVRVNAATAREPKRHEFQKAARALETFRVLGRTLTAEAVNGKTMVELFISAVESAGGKVIRKYYEQFKKYEITGIIFKDAAMIKNEDGGIHFFENGTGIPTTEDGNGKLIFLSPDEMLARGGREINVEKVGVAIDPQSKAEFSEGARALREGDTAALERLKKAAGAHTQTREKSLDPLATYTLLDAKTGEEVSAAAGNSRLGRAFGLLPKDVFIPENVLIDRFVADAARLQPLMRRDKAAWEIFYVFPKGPDDDSSGMFAMKVYSVCRFGPAVADSEEAAKPLETRAAPGEVKSAPETAASALPFDAFAHLERRKKEIPSNPQAFIFDGFAPHLAPVDMKGGLGKEETTMQFKKEMEIGTSSIKTTTKKPKTWFNERNRIKNPETIAVIPMRRMPLSGVAGSEQKDDRKKPGAMRIRKSRNESKKARAESDVKAPSIEPAKRKNAKKKGKRREPTKPQSCNLKSIPVNGKERRGGKPGDAGAKADREGKSRRKSRAHEAANPAQSKRKTPSMPKAERGTKQVQANPAIRKKAPAAISESSKKKDSAPSRKTKKSPSNALYSLVPLFTSRKSRAGSSSGRRAR